MAEHTFKDNIKELNSEVIGDDSSSRHPLIRAAESVAVGYEITPLDDALRYALLGATYAATRSPEASALVYGATTFVTEGIAAASTADLMASQNGKKFVAWANNKIESTGISSAIKTGKVVRAAIATYLGSSFLLAIKQREDPNRTLSQNIKYGMGTAAALGGVCAAEGYAITGVGDTVLSKGFNLVEQSGKPEIIAPAVIALGGLAAARKWARGKLRVNDEIEGE
jgi:hypothetical protein